MWFIANIVRSEGQIFRKSQKLKNQFRSESQIEIMQPLMIKYQSLLTITHKLAEKYNLFSQLNKSILLLLLTGLLWSCEEVIEVDLKNSAPKVVIESFISNDNDPLMVQISESQNFFNQSNFNAIRNATVELSYLKIKEQLIEKTCGYYFAFNTKGVAGVTYTLNVTTSGQSYQASVQLPSVVPIDTAYLMPGIFNKDSLNLYVEFKDPIATANYYRIKILRNGRYAVNDYFLVSDEYSNGKTIVNPIYYRYFSPGDTIRIELLNVEKNTWKYFKELNETLEQGISAQAPGNPTSNFTGDALGIFGAYGISTLNIIVPTNIKKNELENSN